MSLFAALDRLKADLDALRPLAPEQEQRVLQKFRLEWNYNSNAIEGNSLTLGETRSLLLHGLTAAGKPMRDHLDIKGHNEAVLWLEDFVRDERPLTEQFIRGMHEVLLGEAYYTSAQTATGQPTRKMIVPGQYKQQPNNVLTATGEMFYFASPEDTPAQMRDLVDWYRAEEAAPTMHPVALAAEFHYRFVRIHPFDDGNGRMSRLLMNLILLRHGYPMTVIKATDRNPYLAALSAADAGDPEPFLRFIIDNVEAGLQLMIRAAKGESIDEPDDLDKKLALLKKQLMNPIVTHTSEWTSDTQSSFVDEVLQPWLFNLVDQTNRFDFFFTKKKLSIHAFSLYQGQQNRQLSSGHELIGNAIDFLRREFKSPVLFSSVQLIIKWEAFQKAPHFNVNLTIEFAFNTQRFIVLDKVDDTLSDYSLVNRTYDASLFQAKYGTSSDEYGISDLNHQLANKVYDFIAAKVAAADTPPA